MKYLNRIVALFLCCSLLFNSVKIVDAAVPSINTDDIQIYSVPVRSNECPDLENVTFYGYNEKYYLAIQDIADLARFELKEQETELVLTQGVRKITIEKDTGHMTDINSIDQGEIDMLEYNGKWLCEGVPMLQYLGAECNLKDSKFDILMPSFTIWESIMTDFTNYYVDMVEMAGGEFSYRLQYFLDVFVNNILAPLLNSDTGHGFLAMEDDYYEAALYEILDVEINGYDNVQTAGSDVKKKINDFISECLEEGSVTYDAAYEMIDYYGKYYFDNMISELKALQQSNYRTGNSELISKLSSEITDQTYKQSIMKMDMDTSKITTNFFDVGMVALDAAHTSYELMKYDDDTKNLFARAINEDVIKYAGYEELEWKDVSDKITSDLEDDMAIAEEAICDSISDYTSNIIQDQGIEYAISQFTTKAGLYMIAVQFGGFITSKIFHDEFEAFEADMNAIFLSVVQNDVLELASRMVTKMDDQAFADDRFLVNLKDMFLLYYRTIIAFTENIIISTEEFSKIEGKKEALEYFEAVGNYAAGYLYNMTNCKIVPIVNYSELKDDIMDNYIDNLGKTAVKPGYYNDSEYEPADAYCIIVTDCSEEEIVFAVDKVDPNGSFEYVTNLIHGKIIDGTVNFSWTDSWFNEGTGVLRIGEDELYLQMEETVHSDFNYSTLVTDRERTFVYSRALSEDERTHYYENLDQDDAEQEENLSEAQLIQKIIEHYEAKLPEGDGGTYTILDDEIWQEGDCFKCILRYQMSEEAGSEMIENGVVPSANRYTGTVETNTSTGEVTMDTDDEIWYLW